jgi:hypothetical protein
MLRFSSLHEFLYGYYAPRRVNTECLHSAQFMKGEHYSVVKYAFLQPHSDLKDYMKIARFEQHSLLFPTLRSCNKSKL